MDEEIGPYRSHVACMGHLAGEWQNSELECEIFFLSTPLCFLIRLTTLKSSSTTPSKKSPLSNFLSILKVLPDLQMALSWK